MSGKMPKPQPTSKMYLSHKSLIQMAKQKFCPLLDLGPWVLKNRQEDLQAKFIKAVALSVWNSTNFPRRENIELIYKSMDSSSVTPIQRP